MKRTSHRCLLAALVTVALVCTFTVPAADLNAEAEQAVARFKATDPSLTNFFAKASGYVVLPTVTEGGFIIGADHGKGFLYENGKVTGKVSLTGVSVGAQVGGGTFSEIVFLETADAVKRLKEGKCEMAAQAQAVVAASGASANAKYQQGVAAFTLPKSAAMVKAAVGGQKFKFEPIQ